MAQLVNPDIEASVDDPEPTPGGAEPVVAPVVTKIEGPAAEPITPAGQGTRPVVKRGLALAGGCSLLLIALRRRRG